MGTTYFLVFIASMLACLLFFIRKTNAKSYIHGSKDDALDLQELRKAYQRNEIEHPAVEAYVDRYMQQEQRPEWRAWVKWHAKMWDKHRKTY